MAVACIFPKSTLLQPGQIDACSITRINYAFAKVVDGRMIAVYALHRIHATHREAQ